jgi:aminotransferase EvaB
VNPSADYVFRCDLLPQYLEYRAAIEAAVQRVLGSGRYTLAGEVQGFERAFASYVGMPYGIGVANATDGLILALRAIGVVPGDEVITTPYTAIPTCSAIIATGATPVFADVDPDTFLLDIDEAAARVTPRTRAVIPVHIFGNVVDVTGLRARLPDRVAIVEDAAQAHGSTIDGRKAGSLAELSVFSFYPTKNLGGYGDGGMVCARTAELDRMLRLLRMYGMTSKDHTVVHGVNSRLDELQAAILAAKLPHLDAMNASRRRIAERYRRDLRGDLLRYQAIPRGVASNYHVFAGRVTEGRRDALVDFLESRGIQANIYYLVPLHLQEANRLLGYRRGDLPQVERLCDEAIALPLYPELADAVLDRVVAALNEFGER